MRLLPLISAAIASVGGYLWTDKYPVELAARRALPLALRTDDAECLIDAASSVRAFYDRRPRPWRVWSGCRRLRAAR